MSHPSAARHWLTHDGSRLYRLGARRYCGTLHQSRLCVVATHKGRSTYRFIPGYRHLRSFTMSKTRTLAALLAFSLSTSTTAIGGWEQIHLFFGRTTAEATKPSRENEGLANHQHSRSKVLTSLSPNPEDALENTNVSKNGVKAVVDAKAKGTRGGTQFTSTPAFTRRGGGSHFKTVLDEVSRFPLLSACQGCHTVSHSVAGVP